MPTYNVKLLSKKEVAKGTMAFELEKPADFQFVAGQHIHVKILNPPPTEEKMSRHFSIASRTDENILIATRIRDSAFKTALNSLPEDSLVEIRGPSGNFILPEAESTLVFIAGGIGITPFMSMIKESVAKDFRHDIYLLYSNRTIADAPFYDEIKEMKGIHFIPTFTDQLAWTGEKGHITKEMIQRKVKGYEKAIFFVAGPSGFVDSIVKILTELGIKDIREDEFTGY